MLKAIHPTVYLLLLLLVLISIAKYWNVTPDERLLSALLIALNVDNAKTAWQKLTGPKTISEEIASEGNSGL